MELIHPFPYNVRVQWYTPIQIQQAPNHNPVMLVSGSYTPNLHLSRKQILLVYNQYTQYMVPLLQNPELIATEVGFIVFVLKQSVYLDEKKKNKERKINSVESSFTLFHIAATSASQQRDCTHMSTRRQREQKLMSTIQQKEYTFMSTICQQRDHTLMYTFRRREHTLVCTSKEREHTPGRRSTSS